MGFNDPGYFSNLFREEFGEKLIELYHDRSIQSMLTAENILTSEKFTSDRIAKMYIETLFSSPE